MCGVGLATGTFGWSAEVGVSMSDNQPFNILFVLTDQERISTEGVTHDHKGNEAGRIRR